MSLSLSSPAPAAPSRAPERGRELAALPPVERSAQMLGAPLQSLRETAERAGPSAQRMLRRLENALEAHAGAQKVGSGALRVREPLLAQQKRGELGTGGINRIKTQDASIQDAARASGDATLSVFNAQRGLAKALGREMPPPTGEMKREVKGALEARLLDASQNLEPTKLVRTMKVAHALGVDPADLGRNLPPNAAQHLDRMKAAAGVALTARFGQSTALGLGFDDPKRAGMLLANIRDKEQNPNLAVIRMGTNERKQIASLAENLAKDYKRHGALKAALDGMAAGDPRRAEATKQMEILSRRVGAGRDRLTLWANVAGAQQMEDIIGRTSGGKGLARAINKQAERGIDRERVKELTNSLPEPGRTSISLGGKPMDVRAALKFASAAQLFAHKREGVLAAMGPDAKMSSRNARVLERDSDRLDFMRQQAVGMGRKFFEGYGPNAQAVMKAFGQQFPEQAKILGLGVENGAPDAVPMSMQKARQAARPLDQAMDRVGRIMGDPQARQAFEGRLNAKADQLVGYLRFDEHAAMGLVMGTRKDLKSMLGLRSATMQALADRTQALADLAKETLGNERFPTVREPAPRGPTMAPKPPRFG